MRRIVVFLFSTALVCAQDSALERLKKALHDARAEAIADDRQEHEIYEKTGEWPEEKYKGRGAARIDRVHAAARAWITWAKRRAARRKSCATDCVRY